MTNKTETERRIKEAKEIYAKWKQNYIQKAIIDTSKKGPNARRRMF